jgi:hypothetical protein
MGAAAAETVASRCGSRDIARAQIAIRRETIDRFRATGPRRTVPQHARAIDCERGVSDVLLAPEPVQSAGTMSLTEILRAGPRLQAAIIRRALANPRYVGQWFAWQSRRLLHRTLKRGVAR